jgi:propane monooxygenase large subunit
MKQVLRSYFPMQEEKDNRVYGALDAALRGDMFRNVEPRWIEWMKLFLGISPFPEIAAARAMPLLTSAVPNPELHNGLVLQMIDEVRHSTIQMHLKRYYMKNYIDPAGFDTTEKSFDRCYAGTIGRQFAEGFITGDDLAGNIYLRSLLRPPSRTRCSWRCRQRPPPTATTSCPPFSCRSKPTSHDTSATGMPHY